MPVYVYQFDDGQRIEIVQAILDPPLEHATHPDLLHAMPVKRVPQPAVATFKGNGWARK